nr:hypothetical protein [Nitrobacter sp.]
MIRSACARNRKDLRGRSRSVAEASGSPRSPSSIIVNAGQNNSRAPRNGPSASIDRLRAWPEDADPQAQLQILLRTPGPIPVLLDELEQLDAKSAIILRPFLIVDGGARRIEAPLDNLLLGPQEHQLVDIGEVRIVQMDMGRIIGIVEQHPPLRGGIEPYLRDTFISPRLITDQKQVYTMTLKERRSSRRFIAIVYPVRVPPIIMERLLRQAEPGRYRLYDLHHPRKDLRLA